MALFKQVEMVDDYHALKYADLYIIAVHDDAIGRVSENLPFSNRLVVHTSGNTCLSSMHEKNIRGVFYPLQTFSLDREIAFDELPICIEAEDSKSLELLEKLAYCITSEVQEIHSAQRSALHLAAVFVNNFTNHLYQIGRSICEKEELSFNLLKPLIEETAKKIKDLSPEVAQTGPARRNDLKTIENHLGLLSEGTQKEIYQLITHSIQEHYARKKL